ncbi:MAG: hypothetical protein JEZ06_03720 [Anaerolineaceae bacterium]|nr:hypothetical protein [Anaerolineaceae bacterium]
MIKILKNKKPEFYNSKWKRWLFVFLMGIFTLMVSGCTHLTYTVEMNEDGSGTIKADLVMPATGDSYDLSEIEAMFQTMGYSDIQISEFKEPMEGSSIQDTFARTIRQTAGMPQYQISGRQNFFSSKNEGKTLGDVLNGFTFKIEKTEIGYTYFELKGIMDYSQYQEMYGFFTEGGMTQAAREIRAEGLSEETEPLFKIFEMMVQLFDSPAVQKSMKVMYGKPSITHIVKMPGQTPVDYDQFDNGGDFMNYMADNVKKTWHPGERTRTPLSVKSRLESYAEINGQEADKKVKKILELYKNNDAMKRQGWDILGGTSNNLARRLAYVFTGYGYITEKLEDWKDIDTCGDYQLRTLKFLDDLRLDPAQKELLNGLDYGPVQLGGHVAVVLYPTGTDWHQSGIVLDPWPRQQPEGFPIETWPSNAGYSYSVLNNPAPDTNSFSNQYPHISNLDEAPSYPDLRDRNYASIKNITNILTIQSPVMPLLTLADGRQIGVNTAGQFINDLPGEVYFYSYPKENNAAETEWLIFLPDGDFKVELSATGDGLFHVGYLSNGQVAVYGPQSISNSQNISFEVMAGQLSDFELPDGAGVVHPRTIPPEELILNMGYSEEEIREADLLLEEAKQAEKGSGNLITTAVISGVCCCVFPLGLLIIITLISRRKRQRTPRHSAPPPPSRYPPPYQVPYSASAPGPAYYPQAYSPRPPVDKNRGRGWLIWLIILIGLCFSLTIGGVLIFFLI